MSDPCAPTRRRLLLPAAAFGLLLTAGLLMTSLAVFTDTSQVTDNVFSVGSVDISTTSDGSALFTTTNPMHPGERVYQPLTVSNVGTMDLRYAATSTMTAETANTNNLQLQLDLEVYAGVTTAACSAGDVSAGDSSGPTDLAAASLGTAMPVFGDPATGDDVGDRVLAGSESGSAESEVLCFAVEMPLSTTETYAGHQVTVRFDFLAEQTANNP